jgi:NADH pyrophosphatase NudC (nudix superfamily)
MDLGSIFLILGLAIFVAIFIFRPFFEIPNQKKLITSSVPVSENDQQRSILLAERDRVLRALQELDFDQALGKIPEEDYPVQRKYLLQKGAQILKSLDELSGIGGNSDQEAVIEAAVAARRADGVVKTEKNSDVEALINARKRQQKNESAGFCPKCGNAVKQNDQFCARCGFTLSD